MFNRSQRRRSADRHMRTAASGLSEAVPQNDIRKSSYKRQTRKKLQIWVDKIFFRV